MSDSGRCVLFSWAFVNEEGSWQESALLRAERRRPEACIMKTENRDRTLLVTGGGGMGLPQNKPDGFSISVFGRFTYSLSASDGH